ncbi:MAG: dihydrodipicolinate synthase family protein [Opitutaceae bacterium]|nr:dihydrodipicolinate synthase family protein [Opitutaceae bacterium]
MSSTYRPKGIYSAQWIPTDAAGRLDRRALAALIEFTRGHGIHGILALGSTGEFPQFGVEERKVVLRAVVELAGGLPVIANISDVRPRAAVELGRYAKEVGASAVALMPPMFFPVSPADQLAYFLHVAECVGLPVMLYNFPELTGKRIDLNVVSDFADRAPMCGIKQSGAEFGYHRDLVALGKEKHFSVMSGADTRLREVFSLGASGAIGGLVNIVPEWMVTLYRIALEGLKADPTVPAAGMVEVGRIVDQLTFPLNVAAGIEARGLNPGVPKMIVSAESQARYRKVVSDLRELFLGTGIGPGSI